MSERIAPEPTIVCPFLAYDDERDFRASVPDHRHRCFADSPPGPRALAHQAAYCLTSAFAGCPTFSDWARREAAPARDVVPPARTLRDAPAARGPAGPYPATSGAAPGSAETPPRSPEDWAAGPPWAASGSTDAPTGREAPYPAGTPASFRAEAGPAAAAAAGAAAAGAAADAFGAEGFAAAADPGPADEPEPPAFLAGRSLDDGRPVAYQQVASPATHRAPVGHAGLGAERRTELERAGDPAAPPWERPRRQEAYPTLRTRAGFRAGGGGIPRLAMWAAVLVIAVLVVFATPFVFRGLGGSPDASPTPSSTASASTTAEPTPTPEPVATPLVYTVKKGDTLSKIAATFKVTVDQILEANPKITNPNRIQPGDKITIPTPPPEEIVNEGEATPAP